MNKQAKENIIRYYKEFSEEYDINKSKSGWERQSQEFRNFWKSKRETMDIK